MQTALCVSLYMEHPVIFFDGVCNLCNGFVQLIIKHDAKAKFKFAALQSTFAEKNLEHILPKNGNLKTVILWYKGKIYTKSTAALKIAQLLGGFWSFLYAFIIVPKFIRNGIYDLVAKRRYQWFGKQGQCMIPSPELQQRFLS